MTRIGADPEQLKALSGRVDALGRQLDRSGSLIDTTLHQTRWNGRDADEFRVMWSRQHRASIIRAATTCGQVAQLLTRQAEEQTLASDDHGSGPGATPAIPGTAVSGATNEGFDRELLVRMSPSEPTTGDHDSASRRRGGVIPPAAEEIVSFTIGAQATIASATVVGQHEVEIESRGHDRLVTIKTRDGVGLKGSVGSSITLGSGDVDLSAQGLAVLGIVTRKSFETDEAGATMMTIRAELDGVARRLELAGKLIPFPVHGVAGPIGRAVTAIGQTLGVFPSPTRSENLIEIAASGSIAAALPTGAGTTGAVNGVVRMGTSKGTTGDFFVVEAEGTAARAISANIAGKDDRSSHRTQLRSRSATPDQTYSLRMEIHTTGGEPYVVLKSDVADGSVMDRTTMRFDTDRGGDGSLMREIMATTRDIEAGRPQEVLERLAKLDPSDVATSVVRTSYSISTTDGAVGGSVGTGVSVGGLASVEQSRMVRMDTAER